MYSEEQEIGGRTNLLFEYSHCIIPDTNQNDSYTHKRGLSSHWNFFLLIIINEVLVCTLTYINLKNTINKASTKEGHTLH